MLTGTMAFSGSVVVCSFAARPRLRGSVPRAAVIAAALHTCPLLVDGELVHLGADGRPDFSALRRRLTATKRASGHRAAAAAVALRRRRRHVASDDAWN